MKVPRCLAHAILSLPSLQTENYVATCNREVHADPSHREIIGGRSNGVEWRLTVEWVTV